MKKIFDVVVYGDFLNKNTAQAQDQSVLIEALSEAGHLGRVICRDSNKGGCFVKAIPFGSLIPKILTAVEVFLGIRTRNFSQNILFDYFASRLILPERYVIASTAGLKRCLSETKKKNGFYIEVEVGENPRTVLRKIKEECAKMNIPFESYLSLANLLKRADETSFKADYLICLSETVKKTFIDDGFDEDKISVIPITLENEDVFQPKSAPEKIQFFYLAHTQILKGLQYLLEAWDKVYAPEKKYKTRCCRFYWKKYFPFVFKISKQKRHNVSGQCQKSFSCFSKKPYFCFADQV